MGPGTLDRSDGRPPSSHGPSREDVDHAAPELDILLVEDELDIREVLARTLERAGYHVTAVADGRDAMETLDGSHFDVAICDVRLPHVDGMRILERLRRESPETQVIMMSAYGSVAQAVSAIKQRAVHYLAKPFESKVLLQLVDEIRARRRLEIALEGEREDGESVLVGTSPAIRRLRDLIQSIADSDASVLLTGESGTGKELVAREIHRLSGRAEGPLVAVNCAAFPDTLLEAELFGHERGAYTGADKSRDGRFGAANGGTLFLDELGEMPLAAQVKLLRVLEEGRYQRLGSNATTEVDVRIISATNVNVREAIDGGKLREDIYHRLKVFHLHLPPLRERLGDLPELLGHFHRLLGRDVGADEPLRIAPRAWAALRHHDYPGNVRELKHVLEHALVLSGGGEIDLEHLPEELGGGVCEPRETPMLSLAAATAEFEREYLLRALRRCGWHKSKTADMLNIARKTLWQKLKQHRIDGP